MLEASNVFTLALYLLIVYIMLKQYRYCKRIDEPIGWILASIHGVLYVIFFLIVYHTPAFDKNFYNYWSIALRVHFLVTLISIEAARLIRMRGRRAHGC